MDYNEDGSVNIKKSELERVLKKPLGHGTDGVVIKLNSQELLKVYYYKLEQLKKNINVEDEEMKIYNRESIKWNSLTGMFRYYVHTDSGDYIRLRDRDAIERVKEKQLKVKNTRLPINAAYIDGKFAGCVLMAAHGIQLHKFISFPLKFKKKLMLRILENVQELLDNNIYHVDLDNSPYANKIFKTDIDGNTVSIKGHSHIKINPITLKPQIIDLDGKSTIYTDFYSEELKMRTIRCLNILILEFMLGVDFDEFHEEEDILFELENIGARMEYIEKLSTQSLGIEECKDFIENLGNGTRTL